ncbi:rifin PIR protein, putative [Plasmodium reichenowi]|uniref:Rifin PIR protein, putative n=1 Tax=Plasmodium reichenowi TaxID=5854 RepID=A0A2P9DCE4_PLARE|nr:rifin PIR protein, putative [Plasmodium reichenowi]
MKLYCSKILLFFLTLNILLTLYHENTHKKPYVTTPHTRTTISRVLSECDIQSSNYDHDPQMKKVMKKFEDRTSERLREYDERIKRKRQKYKQQRDKNIEKIIEKDKREKSLAEKVEIGCLRCGCALGGGVLPVWGLVSGLWYATLSQHVTKLATEAGIKKGLEVGITEIFQIVQKAGRGKVFPEITVTDMLSSGNFTKGVDLFDMAKHISTMSDKFINKIYDQFWGYVSGIVEEGRITDFNTNNSTHIAEVAKAVAEGEAAEVSRFAANTSLLSNTIIASVVAIVVIVLVMIIIYLVLRYRRKKKMIKKAQYTKLLNQ